MKDIIEKIKEVNLLGRSGSMFPVAVKWECVRDIKAERKYVICNASEGEEDTFKDYFILKNYPDEVINGIEIAALSLSTDGLYIYLNSNYYDELADGLEKRGKGKIKIIKKKGGYIGGEETSIIEAIEGKSPEPRIKPPFPSEKGLWGYPTLVNNVETFYFVSKIAKDEYRNSRFYSIGGDAPRRGVFEFSSDATIKKILEGSGNLPDFNYFLQVGGGIGGAVFLEEEIDSCVDGLGSIIIYNREKTDLYLLMEKWVELLLYGNCDKCTPCREGLYRIREMVKKKKFDEINDLFFVMEKSGLCPLSCVAVQPFKSMINKLILQKNENNN